MNQPIQPQQPENSDQVVIGDGWAALATVAFLAKSPNRPGRIHWIPGTGARVLAPLPALEFGPGVQGWSALCGLLAIEVGEARTGSFLREFRNRSFREPAWTRSPTPEARREVRDESLWEPERRFAAAFDARFENLSLLEVEEEVRRQVAGLPGIRRVEGAPVKGFEFTGESAVAVTLGNGERISCTEIFYADQWSALPGIEGMPKPVPFLRHRDPMGVIQASFNHSAPVAPGLAEGFFGATQREAGEKNQRSIFGCFTGDGLRSTWTLCMAPQETEDNHEIAKKLRRMKQALDKMFTGPEWLPEGKAEFMATVVDEQIRFEESVLFGGGNPPTEPVHLAKIKNLFFLTDGYGPSSALHQVLLAIGGRMGFQVEASPVAVPPEFELPATTPSPETPS